jgi:predicted DNA-binding protein (MmcQ/YjbR family)
MISLESVRRYCNQKGTSISEDFPFDDTTLVIKVAGKAFVLTDITKDIPAINLKCDPDRAIDLRARYDAVLPGYHMNKKHWNTVVIDGSIPDEEILGMIDHSLECVVAGLGKAAKAGLMRKPQKTEKPAKRRGHSRGRTT